MLRNNKLAKKFLVGVVGIGVVGALAACTPPESTSEAPADSTVSESPYTTTEDPTLQESPVAGESPLAGDDLATDGSADGSAASAGDESVAQVVEGNESFSTLSQAIDAAGLQETLNEPGPYTIFAPTDEAFAALPPETLDQLLQPENQELLRQILSYHVVPGSVTSPSITPGQVDTVSGEAVTVENAAGEITVDGAQVVEPDIIASNGVVHGIDQVLLPPGLEVQ